MELTSTFSARLREAMGDMTATDLANELGISKQSISAYLNGTRKPKRFVIEAIASVLHVDVSWLCGFDTPMRPRPAKAALDSMPSSAAMIIARAYDIADEKSRELVELTLREYISVQKQEGQTAG